MGKKKKVTEKVKLFYRGPVREPTKIANESDVTTIVAALTDYCSLNKEKRIWSTKLNDQELYYKIHLGLKSTLRSLKHKRAKAVIYDETASSHLSKYLVEFGHQLKIPVIQAPKMIDFAPTIKLQTLLAMSIEEASVKEDEQQNLFIRRHSKALDRFCHFVFKKTGEIDENLFTDRFETPILAKIPVSGKSKAKKEAKRAVKKARIDNPE